MFSRESPYEKKAVEELTQKPINTSLDDPLTLAEVRECLNKAQSRKAPGSNGIRIEQYKLLDDENLSTVVAAMQAYRDDPKFDSKDWHNVALTLLPKKGDLKLPKNHRPISLIDVLCKLLSSVFANRINHHLVEVGLQEQAGFTPKRGCDDATTALKITLQNLSAAEQEAYVLFVDLVKAFDSVNREMLWLVLAKMGIPPGMISTIKKMYTGIINEQKL